MKNILLLIGLLPLFIISCSPVNDKGQQEKDSTEVLEKPEYSGGMITEIISSVPNPLEMSSLLRKSGVVYNDKLLNPVENIKNYDSPISKALNLGIYGTDFIHMNIYNQSSASLPYLKKIQQLVKDLGVEDELSFKKLEKLVQSNKNVDSILFLINTSYDRINMNFIKNDNSSLAVLMAYGTWIESLYLASNIHKVSNVEEVHNRIGEQKNVLDNLYLLLSLFNNQKEFRELAIDLQLLRTEYDKVSITYQYRPPTTKEINGNLVVIDNSSSQINITDENIKEIAKIVSAIRNKIIS